ncbi:MAG: DUF5063 domain-containing protein [Bacteroidaceae bacterium]|nr:DUF5063 domain-containing protein [Bacteroidaceae bacterium]
MDEQRYIYSDTVLDFVRASAEYCRFLEGCSESGADDFRRTLCALLPMVYLKAALLNAPDAPDAYVSPHVTEEDYNYIRHSVAAVLGPQDDYLDVQVEDFKYSEQPILRTVSENLADVYQSLRDLVETFREGHEEAMEVALADTLEEFRLTWGDALLAALRTLHNLQNADA